MSEGESKGGAAEKAREVTEAIKKLDFRDRVVFLGSAALVLLFFLPWWRWTITNPFTGQSESDSVNGLRDACWLGFIAACASTVAGLANMGFVPLTGDAKRLAGKTAMQLGLAGAAFLMGPIYFWSNSRGGGAGAFGMGEVGHTFFFWLALLAGAGAAGCAGWKLADEMKAAKPPAA
jgi:hypothetical protein